MENEELVSALTEALNKSKNGDPWWSKNLLVMGPTAIIALTLVAAMLGFIPFPVMEKLEAMETTSEENHLEARNGQSVMIDVLRTICVNSAQTNKERNECYKDIMPEPPLSYDDSSI